MWYFRFSVGHNNIIIIIIIINNKTAFQSNISDLFWIYLICARRKHRGPISSPPPFQSKNKTHLGIYIPAYQLFVKFRVSRCYWSSIERWPRLDRVTTRENFLPHFLPHFFLSFFLLFYIQSILSKLLVFF